MPRLPVPGSDNGSWGDVLNDFLLQSHAIDGSLKNNSILRTKLDSAVQLSLDKADAVQSVAAPTGVLATDTANILAAHAALPSGGGDILLQNGNYVFSTLNFTKQIRLLGRGGGGRTTGAITKLTTATNSADAITIGASGSVLQDFMLICSVTTPTAGAGIAVINGDHTVIHRITVRNFYDCIRFDTGFYYTITENKIQDPIRYGLNLTNTAAGEADHGDQIVANNVIGGYIMPRHLTGAAVHWEPSGGLKFVGNKINGSLNFLGGGGSIPIGLDIQMPNLGNTSVCVIASNSIEAWSTAGIRIQHTDIANTTTFAKISITGNEIAGNSGTAISVASSSTTYTFKEIVVSGNTISSCTNGVFFQNVEAVSLGANVYKTVGSTIVNLGTNVKGFSQVPQTAWGANITLYTESAMDTGAVGPLSTSAFDLHREIGSISSNSVYTALYKITPPAYAGGSFELLLAGNLNGVGSFVYRQSGIFTRETGGVVVVADTATTAGGVIDVVYDVTNIPGMIWINVKRNGANGTAFQGRCHLILKGTIQTILRP